MQLRRPRVLLISMGAVALLLAGAKVAVLAAGPSGPKAATEATRQANAALLQQLPFGDRADFEDAERGLIARPHTLTITDADGNVVWDLEPFKKFIRRDAPAPETVNPSLWRQAQLNMIYGLFKVTERVYQVRGFDLANITYIKGDRGWIVMDPLLTIESAKAAHALVKQHLGDRPIVAVIYSHSHPDHYGGVRGLVEEADVRSGRVRVIAPEGFMAHAVSEMVLAGSAMSRRAAYMYGMFLPRDAQGNVGSGLGIANATGTVSLIAPTQSITKTGQELVIDGVKMVFQLTPDTEAPAEMNTYFPQFKAMWMAENATHTLHNIQTLRGAPVRDALAWAKYLQQTIELYGDGLEVKFQAHHWPMWGQKNVRDYLEKQRDLYKYIHDQSLHMLNFGYIGTEIAEYLQLPPALAQYWPNRGYYGTVRHNARAVYDRYMGFYTGNPSDLNELPQEPAARKYVEYMGGEAAVLERARADFERGEYRWVAQVLRHVVFADPDNAAAKELLADAYEQLGYQAESGPWRSEYLQGAYELRHGVPKGEPIDPSGRDTLRALPPALLFDYLAVRLNGARAAAKTLKLDVELTDLKERYELTVDRGVLNYTRRTAEVDGADAGLTLQKLTLIELQLGKTTIEQAIATKALKLRGDRAAVEEFFGLLDRFPPSFDIVTP
ncbi:MBL fold metallo-hydrolase [Nannocystis sp. ILAH1]|uniref:alkyl/aryl-sulfatase n=1 Tax=unclassified Nannocystis TaxID=2627009 RepID=UPI00226D7301|nr:MULTISPECIES: alkyl sulfatase dimerization domain-containing protein [unclassified Nannocystis]MCY0990251.1 MBL fold metallo-hydrolase [Nannocystis sp. ILAH1]MCY1069460.1 MBL fold metallo-hydrolase [Nannocystis sp. RBIL2]